MTFFLAQQQVDTLPVLFLAKGTVARVGQDVEWKYLHVDLVGRVPSHHVQDCKPPTGMLEEPAIQLEDVVVRNDNDVAISNEILNCLRAQDLITIHLGVGMKNLSGVQLCNLLP